MKKYHTITFLVELNVLSDLKAHVAGCTIYMFIYSNVCITCYTSHYNKRLLTYFSTDGVCCGSARPFVTV